MCSQSSPSNRENKEPSAVCFQLGMASLFICIHLGGEGVSRVCPRPSDTERETKNPHCARARELGSCWVQPPRRNTESFRLEKIFGVSESQLCSMPTSSPAQSTECRLQGWALQQCRDTGTAWKTNPEVVPDPASFPLSCAQAAPSLCRWFFPSPGEGIPGETPLGRSWSTPAFQGVCDGWMMAAGLCRELKH